MICDNLKKIRHQIKNAAQRCGRDPNSVRLVAVSKRKPEAAIREAADCGQLLFGENYLQEAREKITALHDYSQERGLIFHFIGHLQSNKAKQAVELFQMIETVDRFKIARLVSKHCVDLGLRRDILVQVNIGRERQKSGVMPEETAALLRQIGSLPGIRVRGLMTMPPLTPTPEDARGFFADLRLLARELSAQGLLEPFDQVELSMGMSRDFEIAIEEGATLVRVGTAIFGARI